MKIDVIIYAVLFVLLLAFISYKWFVKKEKQWCKDVLIKLQKMAEDYFGTKAGKQKLKTVLAETRLNGISTNLDYARAIISDQRFDDMQIWTRMLDDFNYTPNVIEVVQAGTLSSIQDYPGRTGYWDIGLSTDYSHETKRKNPSISK